MKRSPKDIWKRWMSWQMKLQIHNTYFIVAISVFVGIFAGFMAYLLRTFVYHIRSFMEASIASLEENYTYASLLFIFLPFFGIALTFLFRKYVIKSTNRYSITALLYSISKKNSLIPSHKIYSSILGATLTAGFGGSVGLESPVINSGAAIGSTIARKLKMNYKEVTLLLACGSAGAIAAIFSTPIAAIVFALEVLLIDLSRFSLIPLLAASSSGAITSKLLINEDIALNFTSQHIFSVSELPYFILLGILAGLLSGYFTNTYLYIESLFTNTTNKYKSLLLGGFGLGLLILIFPPLYGEGYGLVKAILNGTAETYYENSFFAPLSNHIFYILFFLALIFIKVVATAITTGAGGIGGIFAPSVFTGAILGYLLAFINNQLGIGKELSEVNMALVGMASMLGGVLHAPLTGIFLIIEMTQSHNLILPLMLASTLSFLTVKAFFPHSIATKALAESGKLITHDKDKAVLTFMQLPKIIETNFSAVDYDANLQDLVMVISKSNRNLFPVLDKERKLMGIIELNDVRELMFQTELYDSVKVHNLMTVPPAFINFDENMNTVMDKFQRTDAWNLPVVDQGVYIGFVSKSKLFSVYRKQLMDITTE